MEKNPYNAVARVLAVIGCVLIVIGGAAMLSRYDTGVVTAAAETAAEGIYTTASGIPADAVMLTVDGEPVNAEEYLFFVLGYGYEPYYYYAISGAEIDWTMPVDETGTVTLMDMVKTQAQEVAVENALVRKLAADNGIAVPEEKVAVLRDTIREFLETNGDQAQLSLAQRGYTEALWLDLACTDYLRTELEEQYVSGSLRADDAALMELVNEHGLAMARSILVSTEYLEGDGVEEARKAAEEYRARIESAEDMAAELMAINTELGISDEENVACLYHCGHDHGDGEEDVVCAALNALEDGQLSEVVEAEEGFYLLLREELDMDTVAQVYFSELLESAVGNAKVEINAENMDKLDVGAFIDSYMTHLANMVSAVQALG